MMLSLFIQILFRYKKKPNIGCYWHFKTIRLYWNMRILPKFLFDIRIIGTDGYLGMPILHNIILIIGH